MEFFVEMLLTVVVALLLCFPLAKLVSAAASSSGNNRCVGGNDSTSDHSQNAEIGDGSATDDDALVVQSQRNFRIVDENADRVDQADKGEQSVVLTSEAESAAALSPENVTEELSFGMKMDAAPLQSERNFRIVDENVESVDRFENEAVPVDQVLKEAAKGEQSVVFTSEADTSPENVITKEMMMVRTTEAESTAAVIAEEMIVDERRDSAEEINREIGAECDALMVRTIQAVLLESIVAEERIIQGQEELNKSTETRRDCVEEESRDVLLGKSEDASVEECNSIMLDERETEMEMNIEEVNKEKQEVIIEEDDDDDWEGIERSELENAFAAASKHLEESEKAEEISAEAKMELYGLHKIATEGSCRETQPMAVMVTARAKWNAWQKLGNMSQEEAMEQYLALLSKEIPGFMTRGHTAGKMPETETSVVLPPNSVTMKDPTALETTGVDESSKNVSGTR